MLRRAASAALPGTWCGALVEQVLRQLVGSLPQV